MHYILEVLQQVDTTERSHGDINRAVMDLVPTLKQGGNKSFPRLYFPNGVMSLANVTAEETVGIMFILYLLMTTSHGAKQFPMPKERLCSYIMVFEKLLVFLAWLERKDGFWQLGNRHYRRKAYQKIAELVTFICANFTRKSQLTRMESIQNS